MLVVDFISLVKGMKASEHNTRVLPRDSELTDFKKKQQLDFL